MSENRRNKREKSRTDSASKMMNRRTTVLMALCGIVAFLALGFRLFQLQVIQHDEFEAAAVEQQLRETTVTAKRGTIYDRNMNILAMSASTSNVYLSPAEIDMNEEDAVFIAQRLAEILDLDFDSIYEKTQNKSSWYTTVAKDVEDDVVEEIRRFKEEGFPIRDDAGNYVYTKDENGDTVFKTQRIYGVRIEEGSKRYYPYSSLASHVIGFVGYDGDGQLGVELGYNSVLAGTNGRIVRATNADGTDMLFTDFEDYFDAEDGKSVVLTIDETVQYYLEKHLEEAVADYMMEGGAAGIAMDVNTGAILGMASLGDFDLNNYLNVSEDAQKRADEALDEQTRDAIIVEERQEQWRNKALSETYEPGSTFKIITLAMALESGAVNMDSTFYCGGSIDVIGRDNPLNCWSSGHGDETLTQAVMNSCNIAFVNIGQRVGAERFYDYARAFGFFEKTGIDIAGESGSIWWDEDTFFDSKNLSQLAAASFGQTFTITPLQLITAVSAVANGGYLMKPYVVSELINADGTIAERHDPTVIRQVVSEETSRLCMQILEQVVGNKDGTGKNAYVPGYRIAGKTGTSEDIVYEASTGSKRYIVSFLGIAPADDPKVAVLVLLKHPNPESGVYASGGQMAAPTVGAIMADILPTLGVEPEYSEEEAAAVDRVVPRVIGQSLSDAQRTISGGGFEYRVVGAGATVTSQLPRSGSTIAAGSEIILYCGEEPVVTPVPMTDLTGLDYETARIRLSWDDLFIHGEGGMFSSGYISRQSIPEGELVMPGTVITVSVSDSSNLGRY